MTERGAFPSARWSRGVLLLGLATILLAGLMLFRTFWGDPSIYLPYAVNIAHGDFFSYNPGQFSSGSTSPLWAVLLSIPYLLGTGYVGAKIFSLLTTLIAFALVFHAVRRINGPTLGPALATLFVVEMMALYGVLMYESSLVVILVTLALLAGDRLIREEASDGRGRISTLLLLGAVWGALPLTRPDAVVIVPMQILALWGFAGERTPRRLVRLLAVAAVAAIPSALYFGYSLATLGTVSVSSKCRGFALHEAARQIGPISFSLPALAYLGAILYILLPAAAGLDLQRRNERTRWLSMLGAMLLVVYPVMLVFISPVTNDLARYFLPIAPVIVLAAGRAFARWEERQGIGGRWTLLVALVLVAFVVKPVGAVFGNAFDQSTRGYRFDEIVDREAVDTVNAVARPGQTVLAYEVQDRYYLRDDLGILSLDGITDGKVAPYLASADMATFLKRYRPDYWIANDAVDERPYLAKSILREVVDVFRFDSARSEYTVDGITFTLLKRRERAMPRGFAGWTMLFSLRYE